MESILVRIAEIPAYLRSGDFFQSLGDEDDEQISVPNNTLKLDTSIENNADLEHLLCSLRFWGVSDICEDVILYCLSNEAVDRGVGEILKAYNKNFHYVDILVQILEPGAEHLGEIAVRSGILEIARHLPEDPSIGVNGCKWAAQCGHAHILQYLHEHGAELGNSTFNDALICTKGLACVRYLHEQGMPWPTCALSTALSAGNKDIFQYALQHGCKWKPFGGDAALACRDDGTHCETLRYAILHGYPLKLKHAHDAASNGVLTCLQVLHEENCPWNEITSRNASLEGHLDCIVYLHESGCEWNEDTTLGAICNGHLECLVYAHQHGCPLVHGSCAIAAENGHLPVLQYLHQVGAVWEVSACTLAAEQGHLDCLQYAHEHGCEWNSETTRAAAAHGHLDCLQYSHEHGCPVLVDTHRRAMEEGQLDCAEYNKLHCPELFV